MFFTVPHHFHCFSINYQLFSDLLPSLLLFDLEYRKHVQSPEQSRKLPHAISKHNFYTNLILILLFFLLLFLTMFSCLYYNLQSRVLPNPVAREKKEHKTSVLCLNFHAWNTLLLLFPLKKLHAHNIISLSII